MQKIEAWLNGDQDYSDGVTLYEQHGKDGAVLSLLKLGQSSFTEKKLLVVLSEMCPKEAEPAPSKKTMPDKVLDLIRKRSIYHNNLFNTPSPSDRKKLAFAILSITQKLDKYFDKGEDPDQPASDPELPANGWEMHQIFNNNRSYLTKNKKSEEKKAEIARREQQNATIAERLKEMTYGAV